jgi:hypothetical protein
MEARGEVVVMADADCTYPLEKIAQIVEPVLLDEADMVLGARLDAATRKSMPFLHRFVGTPAITMLVRSAVGGMTLSDSQSGYRAFRRAHVRELELASDGMEFASEMLIRASQAEWRVEERQTGYRERVGESKLSTWSDGWRHLKLIMRMSPQLLMLWPAAVAAVFGVLCVAAAFVIPGGGASGAARWQASFVGILALGLSATAAMAGAFVGRFAKSAPGRMQRVLDGIIPTRKFRRLSIAMSVGGGVIDAGLMAWWLVQHDVSLRFAAGVCGVATSILYLGLVALGGSYVYGAVLRAPAALEPK